MKRNDNRVTVSFYLDADLVRTLRKLADEDERPLSSEVSVLLKRALKNEGIEIIKDEQDETSNGE